MLQAYVVYNPVSGRFRKETLVGRAANRLRSSGWEVEVFPSESPAHVTELAREAAQQGLEAFFLAGGDGSIQYALPGLVGTETALGVLPAGSLNVFARQLGLSSLTPVNMAALEQAAAAYTQAPIRAVDVGYLNDRPFLLWAGLGIDAQVVNEMETKRSNKLRRFAVLRYIGPALAGIGTWKGMDFALDVDGEKLQGHYILGVVTNIPRYVGGYLTLSPEACLDDGLMDFWLFEGQDSRDTWRTVWNVLTGKHHDPQNARCFPFGQLKITAGAPLKFQLDGDPVETCETAVIQVRRRALRLLSPQTAPETLFSQPALSLGEVAP